MLFEETTGTLFPNDLFSSLGLEAVTSEDTSRVALEAARQLGYQPNDPRKAFSSQHNLYRLNGSLRKRSNPQCQRVNTRRQRPATASILR
jgi:hypothetical protein